MNFFTRLNNGWEIAKTSFKVLNAHKELIVFPILSGISVLFIIGSFFIAVGARSGWDIDNMNVSRGMVYLVVFAFYIINYFVVVFFNMALMHCARLYFAGEPVSVGKGLRFSASRIGAIFSWAVFAGSVGTVLKIAQDNLGTLGKILTGLIGIVWSVATFFVIPVIAYENAGPIDAVKRSTQIMKEKWGEGLGANFSIGLVAFFAIITVAVVGMAVGVFINEGVGIGIFALGLLSIVCISSALHSIFISAVYNNINGNVNEHFSDEMMNGLFVAKRRR